MVLLGVLLSLEEKERKRERKKKRERWRIPKEATPLRLGCCVRWVMSISQL